VKRGFFVALVAVTALAGSGCASSGAGMEGTVLGGAADPGEATREIVEASDDLRFDPPSVEVGVGEVLTFVVRNLGKIDHEFVLGDQAYQDMHEADMEGDADMMEMGNAVTVAPGETKELTWRFDNAGEVLYGCHEPGHYEGGMVGSVEVS
jgi:uncharacterized cupredoxin-like copper-binding protein